MLHTLLLLLTDVLRYLVLIYQLDEYIRCIVDVLVVVEMMLVMVMMMVKTIIMMKFLGLR